jgi:hypothetical protein
MQASSNEVAKPFFRNLVHHLAGRRIVCAGFVSAVAMMAAIPANAQDAGTTASAIAQRWNFTSRRHLKTYGYVWPFAQMQRARFAPVSLYSGIDQFLQRARHASGTGDVVGDLGRPALPSAAESVFAPRLETDNWNEIRDRLAERRPDLPDGWTGETNVISFIKYRLPWLNTPESAVHALPTVTLRAGGGVHFDVMGGVIAGRSGAYGQFVVQF